MHTKFQEDEWGCKRAIEKNLGKVFPKNVSPLAMLSMGKYKLLPLFTGAVVNLPETKIVSRCLVDAEGKPIEGSQLEKNFAKNTKDEKEVFCDSSTTENHYWVSTTAIKRPVPLPGTIEIPRSTIKAAFVYWDTSEEELSQMIYSFDRMDKKSSVFKLPFWETEKQKQTRIKNYSPMETDADTVSTSLEEQGKTFPNLKFTSWEKLDDVHKHSKIRDIMEKEYNNLRTRTHITGVASLVVLAGMTMYGWSKLGDKRKKTFLSDVEKKVLDDRKREKFKSEEEKEEAQWVQEERDRQRREAEENMEDHVSELIPVDAEESKASRLRTQAKLRRGRTTSF